MEQRVQLCFGPFRLDPLNLQLWRGAQELKLRPKPSAVLRYLVTNPGRLVTQEELLQNVWAGTVVTSTVLHVCIREIRLVLGETATAPQFIETVGQQGYRFLASVLRRTGGVTGQPVDPVSATPPSRPPFVGRNADLERLQRLLEKAQRGARQLVFVTGEAGIGKTTLVNRFVDQVGAREPVWNAWGQCVESYGPGEAYLPVLEALGRLGREGERDQVTAVLRQYAPTWLVQLPALLADDERELLQRQSHAVSREGMLRELAEALEVLTAERVLVLVINDLQWSDTATLALLAYLARRQESTRLLLLCTYRPTDLIVHEHPMRGLVQELRTHGLCEELKLELLTDEDVSEYVHRRLDGSQVAVEVCRLIYQRTDGNALFMVTLLEDLLQQGVFVQVGGQWQMQGDLAQMAARLPEKLQQLLVKQIEGLSVEEQQILAVASVEGMHFTASVIAAGAQRAVEDVEALCDTLIRQERLVFAHEVQEWPNGTISARYGFRHGLYQTVLYNRLGSARRVRLHRLIGEHKEASYGERAWEIAGELALHFERGRDLRRAVQYRRQAAANALRRSAYQEAMAHCTQGLASLAMLPETVERKQLELALRMPLGAAMAAVQGYATDELEQNLQRARALCQELDDTANLVVALVNLTRLYMIRADRATTQELMEQERQLLERVRDPACVAALHTQLGTLETFRGAHAQAQAHQAAALGLYDSAVQSPPAFSASFDLVGVTLASSSWSLSLSGWLDQAWSRAERGLRRGEGASQSLSHSLVLLPVAHIRQFRGELDAAQDLAQKLISLGQEHRFVFYEVSGSLTHGCILIQQRKPEEGIALITAGLAAYRATHSGIYLPYFLSFLAEGYLQLGKTAEGMKAVQEALHLTEVNLDRFWEAELYRIKGELVLQSGVRGSESQKESQKSKVKGQKSKVTNSRPLTPDPQGEAEACFHKAIEIARQQGAKSLELRTVMSLSRLWQQQGKQHEARNLLSAIYSWFTEGFGTTDLREAKALLDQFAYSNRLESLRQTDLP